MDKVGVGLGAALLLVALPCGLAGGARAADAIPFFKADPKPMMYGPVLPDPSAPECGIDDQACIDRHDARVLSLATSSHARQECAESTHPDSCYDAYDMMAGDFVPKPDPILSDPCAWVVLIDQNIATVSSRKLGITKRVLNHGWKARTFVGACDVNTVAPAQPAAVIPMPAWTVRKGQPARTAAAAPPRVLTIVPANVSRAPGPAGVSALAASAGSTPAAPTASLATAPAQSRPAPSAPAAVQARRRRYRR